MSDVLIAKEPQQGHASQSVPQTVSSTDRWEAWDSFLQSTPHTGFMQSSWWADFKTTVGFKHFAIILKVRNDIVGGAMVLRHSYAPGNSFYYIQEGPVLPDDETAGSEVFEAILAEIDAQRQREVETISHLRIGPRWECLPDFVREFKVPVFKDGYREPRDTLCIDLRLSEAQILAQMKPKGRYNIRVAQRHGVSVVEDTSEQGLADFLEIYQDMARRQEISKKSPNYFETLLSIAAPRQRAAIFFATYKGMRLAAALVTYCGRRATYFFGGSLDIHRNVMAPYVLHFEIMRKAKSMGCEWYDFWGIAPPNAPDHSWQNISAFKRKFGGREVHLVPVLDYVYDPAAYDQYARSSA